MRIAIVENDENDQMLLKEMLENFLEKAKIPYVICCFNYGLNFISDYTADYDIVFMDIDMPYINGIETAKQMRKMDADLVLVFVTNLNHYAIKGYEVSASDYMVKPLDYKTFSAKMIRLLEHVKSHSEPFLLANTDLGKKKINLSQIYYITVSERYVLVHTKTGEYLLRKSMKEIEQMLTEHDFVRIHSSTMVNLMYVVAIEKNSVTINKEHLSYSRNRKKTILDAFTKYLR